MPKRISSVLGKLSVLLSAVGPGLFLIGYNVGTGSVTTMAAAGSRYGLSLFWLLVISCLMTYVMLVAFGRFTIVTGETAIFAFKKHLPFGKWIAWYSVVALSLGAIAGVAGVMGIVVDLIREWTHLLFGGEGLNPTYTALGIMAGCYCLLWSGKYARFEMILSTMVMIMGGSFVVSFFMVVPEPGEVLAGMVPSIPDEENSFLIMAGLAATTCGAMLCVMRSLVIAEKGWTVKDLRRANTDALVSAVVMLVLSGTIMACAAGTLYRSGTPVEEAVDMVKTLEPIAGRMAISIFAIGIIGAGISSILPQAPILPWLISDFQGRKMNMKGTMYRVLAGLGLLAGLAVPVLGGRPVWIMIGVTAFQATMMPIISMAILVLINNRKLMGEHKAGLALNLGIVATLVFSCFAAAMGVLGLMDRLSNLLG